MYEPSVKLQPAAVADGIRQLLQELCLSPQLASLPLDLDAIEAIEFQLGQELVGPDAGFDALYLVAAGRVRLLGRYGERECTAGCLEAGQAFGADAQLCPPGWGRYRAVGTGHGQVFRVAAAQLQAWFEACPALADALQVTVRSYQRALFFRTQTSLQELVGSQVRALAERSCDRILPARTVLAQFTARHPGRYWLRHGQVASDGEPAPAVGDCWGDTPVPDTWQAATDLWVHHLGAEAMPLAAPPPKVSVSQGAVPPSPPPPALAAPPAAPPVSFPKPMRRQVLDRLRRFPWIGQQSSSDCGAACLAAAALYWGKRLPIYQLRELAGVGRSGASLKGLARAAEAVGFQARPVRASLDRMAEQTHPWIAHWQGNHYVVVYRTGARRVVMADPAVGKQVISRQEFVRQWSGFALVLEPTEQLRAVEAKPASLGRYLRLLAPYRRLMLQIFLVSVLIQVFALITPLFTQIILDKVVVQKSLPTLHVFAAGLLMFSLWNVVMTAVRGYLLAYFSMHLDLTMISGFIRHAISLPLRFYESRRVGDIITRVQENQKIQRFLVGQVVLAWLGVVTGFVYLALMLYYSRQLTLIVLALIPPIVVVTLVATPFLRRVSREVFKQAANQNSILVEMFNGIAAVKSASVEQEVRWRWEEALTELENATFKGQRLAVAIEAINGLVHILGSTALLWLGAAMVIRGQLTVGQFVAFNMMIGQVLTPVITLANLWDELQEVLISVERLDDVFTTQPEALPGQGRIILPPVAGEVVFDQVTFRYDEDSERNTLENLSFQVAAGQTVAIVGRSGSGKTTLIKLLERLYQPTAGRICIDGHDIRHVDPASLRSQLGVVPQECFLFSGTVLDNITLYRPEVSFEAVVAAAKLAEAHPFIQALPLGYSTQIGEQGSTLSGGQRQRIAIARALLGSPRILVLDEATSSLDTESERRFQQNLTQISCDRTTFIIAHRLSTVRSADAILVLDRGVVVEQGTHETLMAQQGLYHSLAQQQLSL